MTLGIVTVIVVALCGWLGALLVQRYASMLGLVQTPNGRSSHADPTPTGGGLGIVVGCTIAGVVIAASGEDKALWIGGAALLMAAIGFWDDRREVSWTLRFLLQAALVIVVVVVSLPLRDLHLPLDIGLYGTPLAVLVFLVGLWWVNLYNFMDGIDGLAGMQTLFVSAAAAILALVAHPDATGDPLWWWLPALAAASLGFLALNWAPAKIFMGDVGSTFIALLLFGLALYSINAGWLSYMQWLILGALFITDATVTLVRRVSSGALINQAHKTHAYQHLAQRRSSHAQATIVYAAINLFWIGAMLAMTVVRPQDQGVWTLAAYAPLIVLVILLRAGRTDNA